MVKLQCPICKHEWNFHGKPRGLKHKVRCPNTNCRKWFSMSRKEISEWKEECRPGPMIELCRHGITNRGFDIDNPINSEVEILLRISNPTKERIGISKILVESKDKDYPIAVGMQIIEEKEYKWINSVVLEPEETKLIRLIETGKPAIPQEKKYVQADIEIYDTKNKITKKIPVKLYIGYMSL